MQKDRSNHMFWSNIPVKQLPLLFCLLVALLWHSSAKAQYDSYKPFYAEVHSGYLVTYNAGSYDGQLNGEYDSMWYDRQTHYTAGFRPSIPIEFVFGYHNNKGLQLQSAFNYHKLDIGLVKNMSAAELPFATANMITLKASVLANDIYLKGSESDLYGFVAGLSIGMMYPLRYQLNGSTKNLLLIDHLRPGVQWFGSLDCLLNIRLGKEGWYIANALSINRPLGGQIGNIQMQSGAAYKTINPVRVLSAFMSTGFGYRFGNNDVK